MTYISREDALAREERRERIIKENRLLGCRKPPVMAPIGRLMDAVKQVSADHPASDYIRPSDAGRFLDFLDATEPQVFIPSTPEPSHDFSRDAWALVSDPERAPSVVEHHFSQREGFAWTQRLPDIIRGSVFNGLATLMRREDLSPLKEFFNRHRDNEVVYRHHASTMVTALDVYGEDFSLLDLPIRPPVEPLRVPVLSDGEEYARNTLRNAAVSGVFDMDVRHLKHMVHMCFTAYIDSTRSVTRASRLEAVRCEEQRRRPIYDSLTAHGAPKIIAKAITVRLRGENHVSISEADAVSFANGWSSSKGLPVELIAALLGIPETAVEFALLRESLSRQMA